MCQIGDSGTVHTYCTGHNLNYRLTPIRKLSIRVRDHRAAMVGNVTFDLENTLGFFGSLFQAQKFITVVTG